MKAFFKKCFFLSLLSLTACINTNPYIAPPADQPAATIRGIKTGSGINNFEVTRVLGIDGKNNQDGYNYDKEFRVTPGAHSFGVQTVFVHTFLGGRFESNAIVPATLKAGHRYQLNKSVSDHPTSILFVDKNCSVSVWVMDETGKKVSPVVTSNCRVQQDPHVFVN